MLRLHSQLIEAWQKRDHNQKHKMKQKNYTLIFKPEPEGGFTVVVPSLPGCVTYGKTLEEE